MKKLLFLLMVTFIANTSIKSQPYETGSTYHGFKLIEKKFVKEVNSDCYVFIHTGSGAKLLKIASTDENKTFAIGFKTDPESDAGYPHIMEHSVLNGSKKFPVKSPFDVLVKGSLNTFINAFTGADRTVYPIASMNTKDYFNLMDVYLDAVFNPLIYNDERILKQEGWNYNLPSKDDPITINGIVYNEMKGAFSSPERELYFQIQKILFPETIYRFSSGGYPPSIPEITYEKFINYHKKYYHPSNSYIVLYGNADLDEELKFINDNYLINYSLSDFKVDIPIQKPFSKMKEVEGFYSVAEGTNTQDQTYLSLNFVTGLSKDPKLSLALDIIADVMVNQETAPIRKTLEESNVGKDVYAGTNGYNQIIFNIVVQNANKVDKDEFKKIVFDNLKSASEKGLDKKIIEATLNRYEFQLKEMNNSQLGLTYAFLALKGWFYADNPFLDLEYEKTFDALKSDINNGYLEKVIKEYFLENNHSLLFVLMPEPGLDRKRNEETKKKLNELKLSMPEQEIERMVKESEELLKYQKKEDSKEALATIPMLDLQDIEKKAKFYKTESLKLNGIDAVRYTKFTNNVIYYTQYYDLRVLPLELLQYASLLSEILGDLSTENYSYGELDNALNKHTGGFNSYITSFLENNNDKLLIPKLVVECKSMDYKTDKMIELTGEIINTSIYDDKERIKSLLTRFQSRLEDNIQNNSYGYTTTRIRSYFSQEGMFGEYTGGLSFYWFITELVKNFDKNSDLICSNLKKTASLIFSKKNLQIFVVSSMEDFSKFEKSFENFSLKETEEQHGYSEWNLTPSKLNEGFLSSSKVQYVLQGYDFKKLGYEWSGKMRVLNQILFRDYLYNKVRVIGGAYGGISMISPNGNFIFASYRDPNLEKTFENYNGAVEYIKNFNVDDNEMKRFIIGTIARIDNPLTPKQEGDRAFRYLIEKTTEEELQRERDEILTTKQEDIRGFAKLIEDMLLQKNYCVYGNEDKINENKNLFDNVLKVIK